MDGDYTNTLERISEGTNTELTLETLIQSPKLLSPTPNQNLSPREIREKLRETRKYQEIVINKYREPNFDCEFQTWDLEKRAGMLTLIYLADKNDLNLLNEKETLTPEEFSRYISYLEKHKQTDKEMITIIRYGEDSRFTLDLISEVYYSLFHSLSKLTRNAEKDIIAFAPPEEKEYLPEWTFCGEQFLENFDEYGKKIMAIEPTQENILGYLFHSSFVGNNLIINENNPAKIRKFSERFERWEKIFSTYSLLNPELETDWSYTNILVHLQKASVNLFLAARTNRFPNSELSSYCYRANGMILKLQKHLDKYQRYTDEEEKKEFTKVREGFTREWTRLKIHYRKPKQK